MAIDDISNDVRPAHFRPKILECLKGYSPRRFYKDAMAGVAVGVVALSLCIGLGAASGMTPQAGLFAGVVGGFIISALGGSRVQIGGPAGAFVGLLALMSAKYGPSNVLICTMIAGVILFLMGLFRVGTFIRFVPQPVTAGFTCGIAITIFMTQIRPFFGFRIEHEPAEFLPKVAALFQALPTLSWAALVLGVFSFVLQMQWPARFARYVPSSIVVVIAGALVAAFTEIPWWNGALRLNLETIGNVFGEIPRGLPAFAPPAFEWGMLNNLIAPGFTIALLCAIESLLSAVVADGLIDDRHDSNQELMAQGVANFVSPLFGGLPVTGVIARTATSIRAGASTPVAGMVHSGFLLLVLLVAAPLAKFIPLVSLAVVLMLVAIRMGEWGEFFRLRKRTLGDAAVFLTTFGLTVFFDLTVAVMVGMLLAAFLFVKRVADTTLVNEMSGDVVNREHEALSVPPGVVVYRVFGALLFGAADRLDAVFRRRLRDTEVVILHMAAVSAMDATALDRLENLFSKLKKHKRRLILCGAHSQAYEMMARDDFLDLIGHENVTSDLPTAIARAKELLAEAKAAPAETPEE